MLSSEIVKRRAAELGADLCGIGDIKLYEGVDPSHDPRYILPTAKSIVGIGIRVPRGLYRTMQNNSQYYAYTSIGVKLIEEEFAGISLLKMVSIFEDEGYDACLQRSVPGLRVKGDKETNPEATDTYELKYSSPVSQGLPAPEVIIDYNRSAVICGLGSIGLKGNVLTPQYGPFVRFIYIITNAPLEPDEPFDDNLCDGCGECIKACPGNAIDPNGGLDTWQCSVYYRGAHKSNPFMNDDFLKDHPEREAILNGKKRFDSKQAREIFKEIKFLPDINKFVPCLCGKKCDYVCWEHLKRGGYID